MTAAAAGVGSLGTDPESEWYQSIEEPSRQPPSVVFPLVWTPLYVAVAYGTGRIVDKGRPAERRGLLALTAADLVANAGWNWAFFRGKIARRRTGGHSGAQRSQRRPGAPGRDGGRPYPPLRFCLTPPGSVSRPLSTGASGAGTAERPRSGHPH